MTDKPYIWGDIFIDPPIWLKIPRRPKISTIYHQYQHLNRLNHAKFKYDTLYTYLKHRRFRIWCPIVLKKINLALRAAKLYLGTRRKWSLNFVSFAHFIFIKKRVQMLINFLVVKIVWTQQGLKMMKKQLFWQKRCFLFEIACK